MCYIGICAKGQKNRVKRALARLDVVYRITDHGSHLKVKANGPLPTIRGFRTVLAPDKTKHWDEAYWDFAHAAFKRCTQRRQNPKMALAVMIHYCFNLLGTGSETRYLANMAKRRAKSARRITDKMAHGWEFPHVQALKRRVG